MPLVSPSNTRMLPVVGWLATWANGRFSAVLATVSVYMPAGPRMLPSCSDTTVSKEDPDVSILTRVSVST